jgi:hypothetical protein
MDEMHFDLMCYEIQYCSLRKEEIRAHITFPQYVAWRNPRWSEDEILLGIIIRGKESQRPRRWEEQRTPHPLGAHNFATVARLLGNQIIGVGVRIRSTLLRHT